jgi:hypothetical protein
VECFFRYPFWSKYDTTISAISHREEDEDEGEDEDEDEEESPLSLLFCITISQSKGASYGSSTPVKPGEEMFWGTIYLHIIKWIDQEGYIINENQ